MGKRGSGTMFQRKVDGLWLAVVSAPPIAGKRQRRVLATGKDQAKVRAALEAWREANPEPPQFTRKELMVAARERGTHTRAEVTALLRAATVCRYCKTRLTVLNEVQDHIVPVARGGSDAIDNIQIICWECNVNKADQLDYTYEGEPRPHKPLPQRNRKGWAF